jgi:exopolysaccharide biosynthesis protein
VLKLINQKSAQGITHTASSKVLYKRYQKRSEIHKPTLFVSFIRKFIKILLVFTISFIIFSTLAILVVFHSPYTRAKVLYVTTAMTTKDHQWLAKLFVSDKEIKKIMSENQLKDSKTNTKTSEIHAKYSGSKDVQLIDIKGFSYKGYLLIVKDPSKVCVAATDGLNKYGMKVEAIVKSHNALAGINAGGFMDVNGHGNGGTPLGVLISNKKVLKPGTAAKQSIVGINTNNVLVLGNFTGKQMKNLNLRDAVTFKPFLIINGEPQITKGDGGWGIQPRTAIGQKEDGTMILLTIDGRQVGYSIGATLKDVQDIMLKYGAHNAANLDGGSSTTLVLDNELVNKPCSSAGPRYVPSAFIVKK